MAVGILDPKKGIVWQGNEAQLPPDVIEQLQALEARKRMGGIDTSPVDHWTQGAARVVDALGGVLRQKRLDNAATENTTYNEGLIGSLLGNSGGTSSMAPNTGEQAGVSQEMNATNPAPVDVSQNGSTYEPFINTLKVGDPQRNLKGVTNPYALAAVAATGKAESGWSPENAGRTWADPSQSGQPGTAGGVMSWRGPRLAALQSFAKSNGESGNGSPETQAKFLLQEDPSLIQALNGAKSVEEAQSRMNRAWAFAGYDKPGGESARRLGYASAYLPKFQGGEAAATPQAAIEAIAPGSGYIDPVVNSQPTTATTLVSPEMPPAAGGFDAGRFGDAAPAAPTAFDNGRFGDPSQQAAAAPPAGAPQIYSAQSDFVPELPAPVEVSAPPAVAAVPASPQQQVAQAMTAPAQPRSQAPNINAAIIKAISDPRASESTKAIAGLLLKQQQAQAQAEREQQTWMARQQYEQQQQANDPLRQLQIKEAQIKVGSANRQPLINAGGGALYDPNTKDWIKSPSSNSQFRQAAPEEAAKYGATGGQFGPDGRFYPINPPSGMSLSVGPDGQMNLNQGPGVKPLTEGQSKDSFFTTRMTAATPTIDKFESALLSPDQAAADYVPGGRYYQSEEYQLAKDAGRDFVNAYLRKDSGAALTTEEERNYGQLLLPQPGDKPAIIDAKRQRRAIAMEAIKSGMPSNAIDGVLKAIKAVPGADQPAQTTNQKKTSTGIPWSLED